MTHASKTPSETIFMTSLYQPYLGAYTQMATETMMFATKMANIAMTATQRTVEESLRATTMRSQAVREQIGGNTQAAAFSDIATRTANLQSTMLRSAAEWQKQFTDNLYQYTEQAAKNANRTAH